MLLPVIRKAARRVTFDLQRIALTRGRGGSARVRHPLPPRASTRHDFSKTDLPRGRGNGQARETQQARPMVQLQQLPSDGFCFAVRREPDWFW
jgi:hypothetical protein